MDPMTVAAIGSGAMGLLNYFGQQDTNSKNLAFGRETNALNMEEAQRNRDFQASQTAQQMAFQERMANTAVQRQAEDMRKAGINPLMAATGGASAPSGAAASGGQGTAQAVKIDNPFTAFDNMFTNALNSTKILGDIELQGAQKKLINAQTVKTGVESDVAKKGIPQSEAVNQAWDLIKKRYRQLKSELESSNATGVSRYYNRQKKQFEFTPINP